MVKIGAENRRGYPFWNNLNIDFSGSAKMTLGVQAGASVGALGGRFGLFANLFSASLIGIENGKAIYPGSRNNRLTQFNQNINAGYLFMLESIILGIQLFFKIGIGAIIVK